MDDYKNYIYARDPKRYAKVDAGDLSYQLYIKKKLQCKPFSYFIENVASDMLETYPLVDPPPFAKGVVSRGIELVWQILMEIAFRFKVFLSLHIVLTPMVAMREVR